MLHGPHFLSGTIRSANYNLGGTRTSQRTVRPLTAKCGLALVSGSLLDYNEAMFIVGVGSAVPPYHYTQRQCWDVLRAAEAFQTLTPRSHAILRKVLLGDNGINTRYLALPSLEGAFDLRADATHARFAHFAPTTASDAARRAIASAGIAPDEIDAIIVSTCTGYLCPGLSSYVSELLGLRSDVRALDLVGQGCGAAIPNLATANALIHSGECGTVLSVCVEICSAAFYLDDDPGVLISACLFGDAAGAVVCRNQPGHGLRRIEWKLSHSALHPADRDYLRFDQKNGMLRNILTKQVPEMAGKHARNILTQACLRAGIEREDLRVWIIHAGGRDVLNALQSRLQLTPDQLRWSAGVLREYGNTSSASILLVLQAALEGGASDGLWWLTTFGAGFSCHGALLEVS